MSSNHSAVQGSIESIVYKPIGKEPEGDEYLRIPIQKATLLVGHGIEGDAKGSKGNRQLNIMTSSTMQELGDEGFLATPGKLGEQITIRDLDIDALSAGDVLQIGSSARVEIVEPRTGCGRFEKYQGKLRQEASGRLGMIAKVVAQGEISIGDPISVVE